MWRDNVLCNLYFRNCSIRCLKNGSNNGSLKRENEINSKVCFSNFLKILSLSSYDMCLFLRRGLMLTGQYTQLALHASLNSISIPNGILNVISMNLIYHRANKHLHDLYEKYPKLLLGLL